MLFPVCARDDRRRRDRAPAFRRCISRRSTSRCSTSSSSRRCSSRCRRSPTRPLTLRRCAASRRVALAAVASRSPVRGRRRHAAEYRVTADAPAVLYDAPSAKAKPLFVYGRDVPIEVLVTRRRLDQGARRRRHDRLDRRQGACATSASCSCARRSPTCAPIPDDAAPVVFRAEQNVLLELAETASSPATTAMPGWVKVRHRDGQTGYRPDRAGVRSLASRACRCTTSVAILGAGAWGTAIAVPSGRRARTRAPARRPVGARSRPGGGHRARARERNAICPGVTLPRGARGHRGPCRGRARDAAPGGSAGRPRSPASRRSSPRRRARAARLAVQGIRGRPALPAGVALAAPGARAATWPRAGRRRLGTELRGGGRARLADGAHGRGDRLRRSRPQVAALLRGDTLRAYESDDIAGVEVGGAVKNVLAIAAGASDGLGFGHNARAALDHARTRGDRTAAARAGRPARNADGSRRPRRSRPDLHRRPVAQSPRRTRAGGGARLAGDPRRARPCRRRRAGGARRARARRASRRRHADLRSGRPRAARGLPPCARRCSSFCAASRAPSSTNSCSARMALQCESFRSSVRPAWR